MCCLLAAEALLPPPFPSTAPLRFYVGNVTVTPEARRRGVATSLLQRCELLGVRTAVVRLLAEIALFFAVG